MKLCRIALSVVFSSGIMTAQTLNCDLGGYKPAEGVKAETKGNAVILRWQGEADSNSVPKFSLRDNQPLVQELAARSSSGAWIVLRKDLTPDFL